MRPTDAMVRVLEFFSDENVREEISFYLVTLPDGTRFITPDGEMATLASYKGCEVIGLPTVTYNDCVIGNKSFDFGEYDYGC